MNAWLPVTRGIESSAVRRAFLLVGCLVLGSVVGFLGAQASGSDWWYVAIPGAVALGWLLVANPENCGPRNR
jgi:hypothetical protein